MQSGLISPVAHARAQPQPDMARIDAYASALDMLHEAQGIIEDVSIYIFTVAASKALLTVHQRHFIVQGLLYFAVRLQSHTGHRCGFRNMGSLVFVFVCLGITHSHH